MFKPILYNLANVARFRGRQTRAEFWPYAAFVILLSTLAMALVMVPELVASFERMQRFAAEHPELATIESGPGGQSITIQGYHPELMPDFAGLLAAMGTVLAVAVLLLAAAVTRRLHDCGRTGAWGLIPIPFLAFAAIVMPRLFQDEGFDFSWFFVLLVNNLLYLGALGVLAVLLARPSISRNAGTL